jgi:S-methylmethionine-dependent homocysteine/selenocysteine methylase
MSELTILDGPVGTLLDDRGVDISGPQWSAAAISESVDVIAEIHRDYAAAGATVHTANTFRTQQRSVGDLWGLYTWTAVRIARHAIDVNMQVAGSIAPLADCYRPDLSPADADPAATANQHREMAEELASSHCDVLLCETFSRTDEALIATEQAVGTGVPTWLSLTAGPDGDLLTPEEIVACARRAVGLGAESVLVNCICATRTLPFVTALADAKLGVPIGAYANAGSADGVIGWNDASESSVVEYARLAKTWVDAGATIIGGCCGTTPAHIAALKSRLTSR